MNDPGSSLLVPPERARLEGATTTAPISMQNVELHPAWALLGALPLKVSVCLPLTRFTVLDLLHLKTGVLIESAWPSSDDVPLRVEQVQAAWGEFEVMEQKISLRVTRLT